MPAMRDFAPGETIHLTSRVSIPRTKGPVDPDVVALVSLKRVGGVEVLIASEPFTRVAAGEYTHVIETSGMEVGSYEIVVRHSTGSSKIALSRDSFTLRDL